jgi:asparagine synthase (glutamine-hydrolysing)
MCGIAAHVTPGPLADAALVAAMTDSMSARGPDDAGLLVRPHCALGHRRLSIVDLGGGHQPLANEDGSVWIAYNGEVYNHAALRADLEKRGHAFRTRSDTEAIVHCYEEHGLASPRHLRGMFAFAVWDAQRRRLLLARDRLGIKPLYYATLADGGLLVASDLRALLRAPGVDRTVDEEALACFLALRYVPAPRTLLRGVRKLPPASLLRWELSAAGSRPSIAIERYWDLLDLPLDGPPPTEAEEAARLRELVDECVALRLMSEVPLGAFLSGGLDSTAVVASMRAAMEGRAPRTFAVGYDDAPGESELAWAQLAASAIGARHHEERIDGAQVAAALPQIAADLDEPVADPAAVPLWFVARRAHKDVTVVLSGEGADEIFGGYAIYRRMAAIERARDARWGAPAIGFARVLSRLLPAGRVARAAALVAEPLEASYRGVSRAFDRAGAVQLGGVDRAAAARALSSVFEPLWERTRGLSPLRRMLYADLHAWLPDDLLLKADKTTMAASLELRVPLLDHRLVEHAWSLPDELKLGAGGGKRVFRQAMRGRVPAAILARPKRGFATPTAFWLRGPLAPLAREALLGPSALPRERFSRRFMEELLDGHGRGADRSAELWALLSLALWKRAVDEIPRARGAVPAVSSAS